MSTIETHYKEVIYNLKLAESSDKKTKIKDLKKYIGTNYDFIGLSVPTQRLVARTGFSFSNGTCNEQFNIWDCIYKHADIYEGLSQPFYFLSKNAALLEPAEQWETTKNWTKKIDNWAHSDSLSEVFARLLEIFPDQVYAQLKQWQISRSPWERRQSVVALLYYSRLRKKTLPAKALLDMVTPLLADQDYYVQKGVGWTLREIGNLYPDLFMQFIFKNCKSLHPVAFTSAIEKINAENRLLIKKARKE